ncbi:MAG: LTA synthase family protein, partial [Flavobacteriaceae bacterium]|nr:LTA synthase family protein [Flavobacteriaceae bacterium]
MKKYIRIEEYKVLIYRILLVYVFYLIARILFLIFNYELLEVDSISDFIPLEYHGLAFDTTAILYINTIFILFSILPFIINTKKAYQNFLFYLYFTTNLIGYATNYVDLIYYKFTYSRTTIAFMDIIDHETNKGELFFGFMINYWYVFVLFFGMAVL